MKQFKSIVTILVLIISLAGVAPVAVAQKEPIKTCAQCKKSYKASQFPRGGNICSSCVAKNEKAEEKARRGAEKKAQDEAQRKAQEKARKEAERRESERREAERRESERKKAEQEKIINDYVNSMVYVEGGTFTMGATSEQGRSCFENEKPSHKVTVSSFYIGKTEVTQELWEVVMGSNPSYFKGPKRPVENVDWDDCQEFISKLNAKTGKNFRLPTEAEWEYAARGGNRSQHYKFSGSNNVRDVAWYYANNGSKTHDVANKLANELGIYDMSGNVWEWCQDKYYEYNGSSTQYDYHRVYRGGRFDNSDAGCRVSFRGHMSGNSRKNFLGLRLAL